MSLGENIYRLRTERNMSQGDLAEALDVSRQSISKWETDGATPELDKLVKLGSLFEVSLDELVTGKTSERPEPEKAVTERQGTPVRKVAGTVLLCLAFAIVVLFTAVGRPLEGLILCLPLLVCGAICWKAEKHPGLWCLWALYLMADGYLRYGTGLSWATVRWTLLWEESWNYTRLAIAWGQFLCGLALLGLTVWKLRKGSFEWTEKNRRLAILGGVLFAVLCLPWGSWIFQAGGLPVAWLTTLVNWLGDSVKLGLLTAFLTAVIRGRRGKTVA